MRFAMIPRANQLTQTGSVLQPKSQRMRVSFCQRFEKALGQASLILVLQIDAAFDVPQNTECVV
jgi:UDP-N-acetylmuramate-alanine ligase